MNISRFSAEVYKILCGVTLAGLIFSMAGTRNLDIAKAQGEGTKTPTSFETPPQPKTPLPTTTPTPVETPVETVVPVIIQSFADAPGPTSLPGQVEEIESEASVDASSAISVLTGNNNYFLQVDLQDPGVDIRVGLANNNSGGLQTLGGMATRYQNQGYLDWAIVNGDLFSSCASGINCAQGLTYIDGNHIPNWSAYGTTWQVRGNIGFDASKGVQISVGDAQSKRDMTIAGGPWIVTNGGTPVCNAQYISSIDKTYFSTGEQFDGDARYWCTDTRAITMVGYSSDHRYLYMGTSSGGKNVIELAQWLKDRGAYEVLRLDSGGSSGIYHNGSLMGGSNTRAIANHLAVTVEDSPPQPSGNWHVEYFNSKDLNNRCYDSYEDSTYIFKNWGNGSPASGCNSDNFSARFTSNFNFPGGNYSFHCQHNDGCRVYIDGQLKLDAWWDSSFTGHDWGGNLSNGNHEVKVEFYESGAEAQLEAFWSGAGFLPTGPSCTSNEWCGSYYGNRDLAGTPAINFSEGTGSINKDWGDGGVGYGFPNDNFSVRWQRDVYFDPGLYRFHILVDDGARLWVNNNKIIDEWRDQGSTEYTYDLELGVGSAHLSFEYYENGGGAVAQMWWEALQIYDSPSAEFDTWPPSGNAPFTTTLHIVDTSNITSCLWDYGDGQTGTSCASVHDHTYINPGTYSVSLTVSGPGGSDSMTRTDYITVFAWLAMPTNLAVSSVNLDSITLSWEDNSNSETGFNIYRWDYIGGIWEFYLYAQVGADVTNYTDTGLSCGADYYYQVSAYNEQAESDRAGWVKGTTDNCPPRFLVSHADDYINGWDWQPNVSVDISVDGTPVSTAQTDAGGYFDINVGQMLDLVPGSEVEVSDGISTKVHVISPLNISSVDVDTDLVSGTATSNGRIHIWACGPNPCAFRWETVDGAGNWSADFSIPGDEAGEEQTFDIGPGTSLSAQELDDDGDYTSAGLRVPSPYFDVIYDQDDVGGWDWQPNTEINISVDGVQITIAQSNEWGNFGISIGEFVDLVPGSNVEVTDGVNTKTHIVTPLNITNVDVDTDIVYGTATPNGQIKVWACGPSGCVDRSETVDEAGNWSANFSIPGDETGEEQTFDMVPGTGVGSQERDEDGDITFAGFDVPDPRLWVYPADDYIYGHEWQPNTEINISVDGVHITIAQSNEWGSFSATLNELIDLVPGSNVEVTDGVNTKTHSITPLNIANVEIDTDIISGAATPNGRIQVLACEPGNCIERRDVVDESGNWSANFSIPGDEPGEEQTLDIAPGAWGDAREFDEDGDGTIINFGLSNPTFTARLPGNEIHGYGWPLGSSVALTIDDPNTPQPVDYTDTQTVIIADWDPNQTFVQFRLWESSFGLEPGMTVSMSEGLVTKRHVVTNVIVTSVDSVADTVSGTAEPDSLVEVGHIYCDESGCHGLRRVNANENGDWIADFAHVGEDQDEQEIFDIQAGTGSEARQCDGYGECTAYNWLVPNPFVAASARDNWVNAREWPLGTEVTLTIDGAEGPYTTTAIVQPAPWNPGDPNDIVAPFDLQGYDIRAGDTLTATVGADSKTLIVSTLEITSFDVETDTLSGKASPGVQIEVCANIPGSCISRWVTADSAGDWTVDYGGEFDIQPGSNGWAIEREADSDQTWYDWNVPSPHMDAWYQDGNVNAYDWPFGSHLTLDIDDPTTPASPDYSMGTEVNGYTDWDPHVTLGTFNLNGLFEIQPGMVLTISGTGSTRELVVSDLTITNIDQENDTITGSTEPDQNLWMWYSSTTPTCCRDFQADENGIWVVDYSQPGANGEPVEDIGPGSSGTVNAIDDDGDNTSVNWNVPNPHIVASAQDDWVHAREWDFGTTVYLTINGIPRGSAVLTDPAPWNPNVAYVSFNLEGYDVQLGDVITVEGAGTTKQLTVSPLRVTNVDLETDTISGVAMPGAYVVISACNPNDGCVDGSATADSSSGAWSADLHTSIDLMSGTNGWVQEWDSDIDATESSWDVLACYTLTTNINTAGSGDIMADPLPNCPTDSSKYLRGTPVTLRANPNVGWDFSGWSGDVVSPDNPVFVMVNTDVTITANFTAIAVTPTLLAPNSTLTTWDNMFHWTGIAGADFYQLEVYDAADVLVFSQWFTTSICSGLDCLVSPAETQNLANGDYKWRVRTYGADGFGPYTEFLSFALNVEGVVLMAPSGEQTTWNNVFSWTGLSSADFYQLEVYDTADALVFSQWFTSAICTDLDCAASPAETLNLANGDYTWRVRTYGSSGFTAWTEYLTFALNVAEVELVSPTGTLSSWDNTFTWTGLSSADFYRLEVYDATDTLLYGQWYTTSTCTGLDCAVSPNETANLANGDYKWRVQTYGATGFGPWTPSMNFSLRVILLDAPSGTLSSWNNVFSWTGLEDADFYRLEVYDASDTLLYGQWYTTSICTGLDCTVSPAETAALGDGDYKWRVQTYGSTGFGPWTPYLNFSLNLEAIALVAPSGTLTTWDNTFSWTGLSTADFYQLEVYDAADALVFSQWFTSGICTGLDCAVSPSETQNLAKGDYKWQVRTYGSTGFTAWTAFTSFTLDVQGVVLISPSGTLTTWDNKFSWTGISTADFYQLEVYDASDTLIYSQWFTSSICGGLDCAVSPAETLNLANGDYKWAVRTYGSTGFTAWTPYINFTLNQ